MTEADGVPDDVRARTAEPLPRAFLAWALNTYGWKAGDFERLRRERPELLLRVLSQWRLATLPENDRRRQAIKDGTRTTAPRRREKKS